MAPAVIRMPSSSIGRQTSNLENGGLKICCCRVFTCVNLNILTSNHGLLKLSEVILGSCCQTMLVRFGIPNAEDIGQAFNSCLTTVSACLLTSTLLLVCYIVSIRTFHLVRQSLFVSWKDDRHRQNARESIFHNNFDCFAGDFLQLVCMFHVYECLRLHGIHRFVVAVPEVRIATRLHGLSGNDCCLCESRIEKIWKEKTNFKYLSAVHWHFTWDYSRHRRTGGLQIL